LQYERRFGKRLITSIIYPQNKSGIDVITLFFSLWGGSWTISPSVLHQDKLFVKRKVL